MFLLPQAPSVFAYGKSTSLSEGGYYSRFATSRREATCYAYGKKRTVEDACPYVALCEKVDAESLIKRKSAEVKIPLPKFGMFDQITNWNTQNAAYIASSEMPCTLESLPRIKEGTVRIAITANIKGISTTSEVFMPAI